MTEPLSESMRTRLRKWFRPRVIILILVGILLVLQATIELITWVVWLWLWELFWPVIITAVVGFAGLVVLLRRRKPLFAGLWIVAAIVGFVGVRFALNTIGGGEVMVPIGGPIAGWSAYGGDPGGSRYSPLTQITPDNVKHLEVAWTYRTGDLAQNPRQADKITFEATPILADETLYFCTAFGRVIALDAETGAGRWTYDTRVDRSVVPGDLVCRGVSTWFNPESASQELCSRRIFIGTVDARLIALDAATGAPCKDFGEGGEVDLKPGVGQAEPWEYIVTSPPAVIADRVIVGSAIADNQRTDAPRGIVRAFGARTGELRWSWDPIPRDPIDPAAQTWEGDAAALTGAANAWSIISVDPERDLVFVPTGSASPDYYGGERLGSNLYANSVVALRASTGEVVWYFQTVHHDLWDYDVPAQPTLVTVRRDGGDIPAVAQATKMGSLFLLHRETGEPLFPVEERPVPPSTVPGEQAWPTQPFPVAPPPLVPQTLSPDDAWGLTFWDRGKCRERIGRLRNEGIFTPPSLEGTLVYPGNVGGTNWGSVAFDPARGLLLINANRLPFVVALVPREGYGAERGAYPASEFAPQRGTPYGMRRESIVSPFGIPCNPPPWGTLAAVDLGTGDIRWEVPLGTPALPNAGGPIVTASGLVFIAADWQSYIRAFDVETGKELWEGRLPAGGQATPMTYRLREDAKQYVVIAAGGHGRMGSTLGDYVVAFTLP